MRTNVFPIEVTELQGPYGPLQILENKIQQLWALQHLQAGAWKTRSGRSISVLAAGRWNHGAGPDFTEAVIELDGEVYTGDVEIHLNREDWWRHGHEGDPRYNLVILHVILFAGGMERTVCTEAGNVPEEWIMGPWTREDLESVCGGSPGLFGELAPEICEWIESEPPPAIRTRLRIGADRRWQDKESMARCLYQTFEWEGGLHRMCLYYLGFPFNRKAFYEMAAAYPRDQWCLTDLVPRLTNEWQALVKWKIGRPANRAGRRLTQYQRLNHAVPDWPQRLCALPNLLEGRLADLAGTSLATRQLRQLAGFANWRDWLREHVLGGALNASLCERLWIDVFLPMLVARDRFSSEQAFVLWFHGWATSFPKAYRDTLRLAGIQSDIGLPLCNGWIQGMLWLEDQLRLERIRSSIGGPVSVGTRSDA